MLQYHSCTSTSKKFYTILFWFHRKCRLTGWYTCHQILLATTNNIHQVFSDLKHADGMHAIPTIHFFYLICKNTCQNTGIQNMVSNIYLPVQDCENKFMLLVLHDSYCDFITVTMICLYHNHNNHTFHTIHCSSRAQSECTHLCVLCVHMHVRVTSRGALCTYFIN